MSAAAEEPNEPNEPGEGEEWTHPQEPDAGDDVQAPVSPPEPSEQPGEESPVETLSAPQEPAEEPVEGETEEPPSEPEPQALGARDQREIERVWVKIEGEHKRHANRLEDLLGADFAALEPCPMCAHATAGYIGLAPVPEETLGTLRVLLGMPDLANLRDDPELARCETCDGKGETRTPSDVPGYEKRTCPRCNGIGYRGAPAPLGNGSNLDAPQPVVTGPTVAAQPSDDPEVEHLRARGFTVFPPANIVTPS